MTERASRTAPWGSESLVAEVASATNESGPSVTDDELELHFRSDRDGTGRIALRSDRSSPFGTPTRLTEVGSASSEYDPWISSDLRTLLFTTTRDGDWAIWIATR